MRKSFHITLSILIFCASANTQDFEWSAGLDGFLDNREYESINIPQTIFGARIRAEVGGLLNGRHRLRGGLNYLYEFGSSPFTEVPDVTMYYELDQSPFRFRIGAFPRRSLLHFPIALLSDTLHYYRPNIQGVYFGVKGNWGYQNIFIDWTSRQTETRPEQFIFGQSGEARLGIFFYNHHIMMAHLAGMMNIPDQAVRDNGGFDLNLGADLGSHVPLDTLWFSLGTLVSLDRSREFGDAWQTPAGVVLAGSAMWKGLGIEGRYYRGEGHTFHYGDPFYRLQEYGRLDFFWAPFCSGPVQGKLNVILHFARGQTDHSQQILLSVDLNGLRPARKPSQVR